MLASATRNEPRGAAVVGGGPDAATILYDGADILQKTVTGGANPGTTRYIHGPGVDEPLAQTDGTGTINGYFHADGLGSIVATTSTTGTVTGTFRYDAYGNIEAGAPTTFAYTGREWDPETNLYYYRARYYDPKVGRFMGEDPIGFTGGMNFYAYAGGNPARYRDPSGKDWKTAAKGVATGAAAAGLTVAALAQLGVDVPNDVAAIAAIIATAHYIRGQNDASLDQDQKDELAGEFYGGVAGAGLANSLLSRAGSCPESARNALNYVRRFGAARPGYQGGRAFLNDGRGGGQILPGYDGDGVPISYQEWDINPYQPGVNRGGQRIVTGSDGSAYYTGNHYETFTKMP